MGKPRSFARPLSWLLAKLRVRNGDAHETLRLSLSGSQPGRRPSGRLEDTEELLWTCR